MRNRQLEDQMRDLMFRKGQLENRAKVLKNKIQQEEAKKRKRMRLLIGMSVEKTLRRFEKKDIEKFSQILKGHKTYFLERLNE